MGSAGVLREITRGVFSTRVCGFVQIYVADNDQFEKKRVLHGSNPRLAPTYNGLVWNIFFVFLMPLQPHFQKWLISK